MNIRRIRSEELPALLDLYKCLHPDDPEVDPGNTAVLRHWQRILADPALLYFVGDSQGRIVSTCTLAVIPNLTRGLRPYGLIENVVTHPEFRKQGWATSVLQHALRDAWKSGCYKVMLLTGSQQEETLRFYEKAGFKRGVKTGYIAYPTKEPAAVELPIHLYD